MQRLIIVESVVNRIAIIVFIMFIILAFFVSLTIPRTYDIIEFTNDPCIRPHSSYHYYTCHAIRLVINGRKVEIPAQFDTDLASIPRWYWVILSPNYSGFVAPSIMHDFMYKCPNGYSRLEIDRFFYYALLENGISQYTAYKMYIAVRIFGSSFYQQNTFCLSSEYVNE